MTDSKKPAKAASPDTLAKTSPSGSVELSETQLADTAGGLNFTSQALKIDTQQKWDPNTGLLLPAVKPGP
jgi:hypothetical protein